MAYVAVRYMDNLLKTNGDVNGVKSVVSNLVTNNGNIAYTLDSAINDAFAAVGIGAIINYSTTFATNFKANGAAYIGTMDLGYAD